MWQRHRHVHALTELAQQEIFSICDPRQMSTSKGLGPYVTEGSSRHEQQDDARYNESCSANSRMTAASANDNTSGSKMAMLPDGRNLMRENSEREYCPDLNENKLQRKAAQYAALNGTKDYGVEFSDMILPVIAGQHETQKSHYILC